MPRKATSHSGRNHLLPLLLVLACVVALTVEAADGDPDASFGSGEKVRTDLNTNTGHPSAIALQHDGKIVMAPNAAQAIIAVGNTNDSGPGSLREAILFANQQVGEETITFNIPTSDPGFAGGVYTIKPLSPLPILAGDITIDGSTQTVFGGNTNPSGPEIVINGSLTPAGIGLEISGDNNSVTGLVINGFTSGIAITKTLDQAPSNNFILNNYIGTDASATSAVPNQLSGVSVTGGGSPNSQASQNFIEANTISGNAGVGISLCDVTQTFILGNLIGVGPQALNALGNGGHGIQFLCAGASRNSIIGNFIAFNGGDGFRDQPDYQSPVALTVDGHQRNLIQQNLIFDNGGLGINLLPPPAGTVDGITPNDACDADQGGNLLQNFPVLRSATTTGGITTIQGTLNSTPNTTFLLEFFVNDTCDPSGNGEGKFPVGIEQATTDANCNASFTISLETPLAAGKFVTATAADLLGNTSEFSACLQVSGETSSFIVTNTNDSGAGSLRQAILDANAASGTDFITFAIPGSGVQTITPVSPLPEITDPVILDGTTQPGFAGRPLIELSGASAGAPVSGLLITAGNSTVRGMVINRFDGGGFANGQIVLATNGGNKIESNFLGTDATGTVNQGSTTDAGVLISSSSNTIGGTTPAARNVISGNGFAGVDIRSGAAVANLVLGNFIGTDVTGTADLGNRVGGVFIANGSTNNVIGGTVAGSRNVISGNDFAGLDVRDGITTGNLIQGNFIGTDVTGTIVLANGIGVSFFQTIGNLIGGTTPGAGNTIVFNSGDGVNLNAGSGNAILSNSIFSNSGLGIRLVNGGNNNQAAPLINSATTASGVTTIQGALTSTANTTFTLQFYANSACDPSGAGEGQTHIASISATTDGAGNASFTVTPQATVALGQLITATATDPSNNTSQFSACRQVTVPTVAISGRVVNLRNIGVGDVAVSVTGTQSATTMTDINGNYSFPNLSSGGSYTVTPAATEVVFTPTSRTFNGLVINQTGADFVAARQVSVATPAGSNVTIQFPNDGITLTFANVTTAGTTTLHNIDATRAGSLPFGYTIADPVGVDISTTATTNGPIIGCTTLEVGTNFSNLRILHGENGVLVDRTTSSDPQTLTLCATVDSLSPFVLAQVQTVTISGTIFDNTERGLGGVTVSLTGTQQAVAITDINGNYIFTVLSGGTYTITPSKINFLFEPQNLFFQGLTASVANANFFGSFLNFSISGRVTDSNGNGIPAVTMTLAGAGAQTQQTDAIGNYSFPQVAAGGNYILTPTKFGLDFSPLNQVFNNLSGDQTSNFLGTPQPNPTPTPTPSQNFDNGTVGPNFTPGTLTTSPQSNNPNVTVTVVNGQLVITPLGGANGANFNGIVLIAPIDLTATPTVSIEAVQVPPEEGALSTFALGNDGDNWYRFAAGTDPSLTNAKTQEHTQADPGITMLFFQTNLGGTKFSTGIPYDAVAHRFWRFRFDTPAQTINFETSPDAMVWTLRYTSSISKPVTGLTAELSAGTTQSTLNPDAAIFDNFSVSTEGLPVNRIDQTEFFVRQHYLDFLNREPDPGGFAYWTSQIQQCGNDQLCIHSRRIGVSGAFFAEQEFQQTGTFVYLLYKAAFNRRLSFAEFQSDRNHLVVGPNLEQTKVALADDFVARPAFKSIYDLLNSVDYVDTLYANAGIVPTPEQRAFLVIGLLTGDLTRGNVLLLLAENQAFVEKEFNSVFVLMEYFGYLQRNPDESGYAFWLDVINNREPNNYRGMICGFITSAEYQLRFGSTITRSNADCSQ